MMSKYPLPPDPHFSLHFKFILRYLILIFTFFGFMDFSSHVSISIYIHEIININFDVLSIDVGLLDFFTHFIHASLITIQV